MIETTIEELDVDELMKKIKAEIMKKFKRKKNKKKDDSVINLRDT